MMMITISLMMKLQQEEEESGLLVKSCLMALRPRHHWAAPSICTVERSSSTVSHLKTTTSLRGEQLRSTRRTSTPHVQLVDTKRWGRLPSQTPPQVTPLYLACEFRVWDTALLLLSRGADPNKVARRADGGVITPLFIAVFDHRLIENSTAVCRSFLARGARLDQGEHHLNLHLSSSSSSSQLSFG